MDVEERMNELESRFNELVYLLDESDIKAKVDFEHLLYDDSEDDEENLNTDEESEEVTEYD